MTIKSLDDIERERNKIDRERFKENVSTDMADITNKFKEKVFPKKKKNLFSRILITLLGWIILLVLILGCVWLITFFIRSIFKL